MPPAGAIPIMAVLYLLFGLVIPQPWIQPFCGGFIIGYLIYDYIHYSTHHFPMRNPLAKFLKLYHLRRHYSGEGGRFGVSSPVWDWVCHGAGATQVRDRRTHTEAPALTRIMMLEVVKLRNFANGLRIGKWCVE